MRKKYKPKPIRANALEWVISGLQPMAAAGDALVILRIKNHGALEAILAGKGGVGEADTLIAAMNITEALARMDFGNDWADEITAAQDALFAMSVRGLRTGSFGFTADELDAMNTAMGVHDAQLDAITIADMEVAINTTKRIIAAGRARVIA